MKKGREEKRKEVERVGRNEGERKGRKMKNKR